MRHRFADRRALLRFLGAGCVGAVGARPALALMPPTGQVLLTLSGRVLKPNLGKLAVFDMPMLEALPQTSFSTRTPWWARSRRFTGPLLRDVLAAAGASGATLHVGALNDYQVDIPYQDAERFDLIIARLLDDRPMAAQDRGPLFLIYPFDARAELQSAVYHSRSAWQLRTIEVR